MPPSAGAIRAGRAFVSLFAEPNQLYRALDKAKQRVLDFAKFTGKIGVGAAGLGGAVLTPIAKFFTDAVGQSADIELLARRFHTTAESLSTLRGAFAQAGIPAEEFGGIMDGLAQKISHAADSRDELIQGLTGLRGDFLLGKGIDEQLDLIAEKFKTIVSAEDQIRVANELGLGGMIDYLKKGKAGLDAMRAAAVANGDVMSSEDAKAGLEIQREYNRSLLAVKSTLISVGKALLPTGKDFASLGKDLRDGLAAARQWVAANKGVIITVTAVAVALLAGGTALVGFSGAVAALAPLLTTGIVLAKGLAAGIALIISPAGLAVAAIAAITAGLIYLFSKTELGAGVFADLKQAFGDFADFLKASWKGVSDAIKAGDFTLAFKIGLKTAEVAWAKFVNGLTIIWVGFKDTFVDAWREAVAAVRIGFISLVQFLTEAVSSEIHRIVNLYNSIAGKIDKKLKIDLSGVINTPEQVREKAEQWKKDIEDEKNARDKAARDFRSKQLNDGNEAVARAQRELDALNREAAEGADGWAKNILNGVIEAAKSVKGGGGGGLPSIAQLFANQKGIFGGNAQQQLAVGDNIAQRQLDAAQATAGNTAKIVDGVDKLVNKPPEVWPA